MSALIVSWNSLELLRRCLATLRAQTLPLAEIVVVDNGSFDGSVDWLRRQPDVALIENAANAGFAAANNQGFRRCRGEVVLCVNPDIELAPDYLELCLAGLAVSDVGSVTGKLLRAQPAGILDSAGHNVYRLGWAENRGEELPDVGFDQRQEVFGVCAAAALYRRAALDSVAIDGEVFDETYFSYIEDVDLDWRLRWMGWRAWYEPAAVAIHHRGASGARFSAAIMRHILKNRLLTVVKNYDARALVRSLPGIIAFTVVKTGDFGRVHPASVLGLWDAARLLPEALRRRRWIHRHRQAPPSRVSGWLQPFPWRARLIRRLFEGPRNLQPDRP